MTIEYRFWFFAKSFFQSSLNACHASVPIATASNTIGISFSMSLLLKNNGEEWAMGIMAASRIRLFNKATVRNAKRQENWRGRITPFSDIKYRRRKFIEIIAQRTLKKRKKIIDFRSPDWIHFAINSDNARKINEAKSLKKPIRIFRMIILIVVILIAVIFIDFLKDKIYPDKTKNSLEI